MNVFDPFDDGEHAALKTLGAVAAAVSDSGTLGAILAATETARDERVSADAATKLAREEREAADVKLAELKTAGDNHADWLRRTEAEWRQRDSDLREDKARHEVAVAHLIEGQNALAEEWRKVSAAKAAMRAHIGEAA